MTPRERFLAAIRRKSIDRIPLDIQGFNQHLSPVVEGWPGFPSTEEPTMPAGPGVERLRERLAAITTVQHAHPIWINRYLVVPPQRVRETVLSETSESIRYSRSIDTPEGALTAVVERRKDVFGLVSTVKYPVDTLDDVGKLLSVPFEPPTELKPFDSSKLPDDPLGRRVTYAYVTTPAITVAGAMGMEQFLLTWALEPSLISETVEQAYWRIKSILDVALSGNTLDVVWIGGSEWLTPPMASPAMYEELVHHWEEPIIRQAHDAGSLVHLHCHGNISGVIETMITRGADYTEPVEPPPHGDLGFSDAVQKAKGRMALGGNIEVQLLETGSAEEIEKAATEVLETGTTGIVLATSAGSNRITYPPQMLHNLHRLVDVWEQESRITP